MHVAYLLIIKRASVKVLNTIPEGIVDIVEINSF